MDLLHNSVSNFKKFNIKIYININIIEGKCLNLVDSICKIQNTHGSHLLWDMEQSRVTYTVMKQFTKFNLQE